MRGKPTGRMWSVKKCPLCGDTHHDLPGMKDKTQLEFALCPIGEVWRKMYINPTSFELLDKKFVKPRGKKL